MSGNNKTVTTDKWTTVTSNPSVKPQTKSGEKSEQTEPKRAILAAEENGKSKQR